MTPAMPIPTAMTRCIFRPFALLAAVGLVAGCSVNPQIPPRNKVYDQERFSADAPYSRTVGATPELACDAARRVLMSQGYAIHLVEPLRLNARKFFKPASGTGVELAMNVTCLPTREGAAESTVYVVGWQDEFVTKRVPVVGSVGVPVVGSVSMPVATTEDSLIKVGVETIQDREFYERFFDLLQQGIARR